MVMSLGRLPGRAGAGLAAGHGRAGPMCPDGSAHAGLAAG